jgi:hypothetical protein
MIMAVPNMLTELAAPWANFYSHSKVASTVVVFLHIIPIVIGGGLGISVDRATLRLRHDEAGARTRHLAELHSVHPIVIGSLALSFLSGIALFAADLETYFGSWVFWLKMVMIAALLANGWFMTRAESKLIKGGAEVLWRRLRLMAVSSLVLWIAITFVGVVLVNLS